MIEFTMPSLGADMESGKFVEWHVKPGDVVRRGDVVCVIETQKGAVDVEIWEGGTIVELVAKPGETIPVGGVLARLTAPADTPEAPQATVVATAQATVPSPPKAEERRPEADRTAAAPSARPKVTPAARRRAAEAGVDPDKLAGTGPDGAITLADVELAATRQTSHAVASAGGPPKPTTADSMRAAIAAAMSRSKREIPHYYLANEVRVDRAIDWLAAGNADRPITGRILFAALQLKAVAMALRETPFLNGHFVDGAFRGSEAIHVGVAIAMRGGGLVAPAIHDTDRLGLDELMHKLKDVVQRARTGQLRSSEITDPTITVTNLGDLGVASVWGVIYPPQVAIVGLGRAIDRPWVESGNVVAARTLQTTLAGDHRVSDGMGGARFLAALDQQLQAPESLR